MILPRSIATPKIKLEWLPLIRLIKLPVVKSHIRTDWSYEPDKSILLAVSTATDRTRSV
jgi:hypothetical protein